MQIVNLLIWLIIIPFCIGLLPVRLVEEKMRTPGVALLAGYLVQFTVFELLTVPAVILIRYHSFVFVVRWFTVAALLLALLGLLFSAASVRRRKKLGIWKRPVMRRQGKVETAEWGLVLLLLLFQLYMAVTRAFFDGDDAYYVVQSLLAQQTDTMYTILPYTGSTTSLDIRHSMAVFPMWVAYIARMSDVHATIVSHTALPAMLIPLTYLIYLEIGKRLFKDKPESLPTFMIFMELLQIFGNVSIYTNETFFLTRTWQGKSMLGNFVIPAVIWLLLWLADDDIGERHKNTGLWALLLFVNLTAGLCSSMGVLLCLMLIGIITFLLALRERKLRILVKGGLVCIPNVIYMLLYLLLK